MVLVLVYSDGSTRTQVAILQMAAPGHRWIFYVSLHASVCGLPHNTTIKYENIRYDPEQAYSHTTGSYRCPLTRTYVLHVTLTSFTSHNGNLETKLVKNEAVNMRTTARKSPR